jgi:hypothetical protein
MLQGEVQSLRCHWAAQERGVKIGQHLLPTFCSGFGHACGRVQKEVQIVALKHANTPGKEN